MFVAGGCAQHGITRTEDPPALVDSARQPGKSGVAGEQPTSQTPVEAEVVRQEPLSQASTKKDDALDKLEPIANSSELKTSMEKIYFNFDSYALSSEARGALVKNAGLMKNDGGIEVTIEGHCDERGSDEYNLALGERRARAAMQYLVTMGIPNSRISVISYGREKPSDPGHDEAAWAKNRRDEFVITTK